MSYAEKYCPNCKTTICMVRDGIYLYLCPKCEVTFTHEKLTKAFINLRNDPEYATKGISMPQTPEQQTTGALKHDTDKPRMELLDVYAMEQIALVMTFGARKYSPNNWRQGFHWTRLIGAALRHLTAFSRGEDKDPESGLSHLAHAGCCIMFLLYHEKAHQALDDRFKYEVK